MLKVHRTGKMEGLALSANLKIRPYRDFTRKVLELFASCIMETANGRLLALTSGRSPSMKDIEPKRAAPKALWAAGAFPTSWSSGQQRIRPVINKRNTIAFFVILFVAAIAMSFATYAIAAGV